MSTWGTILIVAVVLWLFWPRRPITPVHHPGSYPPPPRPRRPSLPPPRVTETAKPVERPSRFHWPLDSRVPLCWCGEPTVPVPWSVAFRAFKFVCRREGCGALYAIPEVAVMASRAGLVGIINEGGENFRVHVDVDGIRRGRKQ